MAKLQAKTALNRPRRGADKPKGKPAAGGGRTEAASPAKGAPARRRLTSKGAGVRSSIEVLEQSFAALAPRGEQLVARFYEELFRRHPQVEPLFAGTSPRAQQGKLLAALKLVVENLRKPEALRQVLRDMGARHQGYGALAEHYPAVAETLLEVMAEFAGRDWTDEVSTAWREALDSVAATMLEGYQEPPSKVDLLEDSFAFLAPWGMELVERFYEELFARHPQVKPLFAGTPLDVQHKKLLGALELVVANLREPGALRQALLDMGARHQRYGALAEHYPAVADTLLRVMAEFAGEYWTEAVAAAWAEALNDIASIMLEAYQEQETRTMATSIRHVEQKLSEEALGAAILGDREVLEQMLEHSLVNVMIADAEENIVFVNRRAREVLGGLEEELRKYLPGFRADEVVGGSIHRYHRDPDAIKRILRNLRPGEVRKGRITPGPFIFEHETRVLSDRQGNRLGYIVQWQDVTRQRAEEEQSFRLQKAIDGAQTAVMMIHRDLTITYINEETRSLMRRHQDVLRGLYRDFDAEKLVGSCIDRFHKDPSHQRRLLDDPANLPYETDIKVGPLTFHLRVSAIYDLEHNYIGNTLEWADVTELRAKEIEVARLTSAVSGATTALMLCDADLNITYVNPAVVELLSAREAELRRVFPGFNPRALVGQSIDQFHRNPAHQRAILTDPARLPYQAEIKVADLEFQVTATAILDPHGNYMGNMVEWKDITEQKDAERQVRGLIDAAGDGELDRRIDATRYTGFMKGLAEGVNQMLDAVVGPIKEGTRVMAALAQGDLTAVMNGEYKGQFAVLRDAVNDSMENLRSMVGRINEGAASISSAASEISQGNADLSQRTEEQASSLEETASSMEELTGTVKQNADNARQANQLAVGAREQAEKGGEVVGSAVAAMGEINDSSKKIADIIGVIDEIAFQTNLLALNAAVEAARAGEQGRGFAVVAGEVRNLAQRSATAAKEIKALIKDSVAKVEDGTRLVDASGRTLEEIVTAVKKVSDIVAEIAAASQEQSVGIEQVNKAVMQMDEVTQQNAALVEPTAAASEALNEQAHALTELMKYFSTGEAAAPEAPTLRARPRGTQARPAQSAPKAAPARGPRPAPAEPGGDSEWEEF